MRPVPARRDSSRSVSRLIVRAQLGDARAVLAVGADNVADARILLLQATAVQVERLFVYPVEHDDGRADNAASAPTQSTFDRASAVWPT